MVERGSINMTVKYAIKEVLADNIRELQQISRQTFLETFGSQNSAEDMREFLDTAYAEEKLKASEETLQNNDNLRLEAIKELKELLHLEKVSRMESFDNSHLFGTFYVGGMVVFDDFLPLKNEYRKFKISADAHDDLAAMKEVLYRRYSSKKSWRQCYCYSKRINW